MPQVTFNTVSAELVYVLTLGTGASKVAATRMANNIIGLLESLHTIESMIHTNTSALSSRNGTIEGALSLEDLHASATRLQERIKRSVQLLTGRDHATAQAVKTALKNAHLAKVYKCKAIQLRLANRVRNSLLAAVPFKRRISRVKKGECFSSVHPAAFTYQWCHLTDLRIKHLADNSIAQRVPSIKQLAKRYNVLCESLSKDPNVLNLGISLPQPVDILELFNVDANPSLWRDDGILRGANIEESYACSDSVQQGINAVLAMDRVKEEDYRLIQELRIMAEWIRSRLLKVDQSIARCQGTSKHYTPRMFLRLTLCICLLR